MLQHALVRLPGAALVNGIRENDLGKVKIKRAIQQHAAYREALETAGTRLDILEPDNRFPDGPFVEDTAVVLGEHIVITRPGDPRRRGEVKTVEKQVSGYFESVWHITEPGTVDGGDVLVLDRKMWIGVSCRTNRAGADQLGAIGHRLGFCVRLVDVRMGLHLKTFVGAPGPDVIWMHPAMADEPVFQDVEKHIVQPEEGYACNCRWINGWTIMASGFSGLETWCRDRGLKPIPVPMSEYRKLDGGISCLSVVW